MALRENIKTSTTVDDTEVQLQREWLHGLLAWAVHLNHKKLGWVLQESEGPKWAYVTVDADPYDDIEYWFDNRRTAIKSLLKHDA